MSSPDVSRSEIEQLIGRPVDDLSAYRRALTHRSLLRATSDPDLRSNERLEFLGDALIELIVTETLHARFPEKNEGALTRLRAKLVSGDALAQYARHMGLGPHLRMSENAIQSGGRTNPSILADAFEALTAALYVDHDYEGAAQFVHDHALGPFDLEEMAARQENYKSRLLERMQAEGRPQPTYRVVHEAGPSHDKTFTVEAVVGEAAFGRGTADSKQQAEQEAARRTLDGLEAPS